MPNMDMICGTISSVLTLMRLIRRLPQLLLFLSPPNESKHGTWHNHRAPNQGLMEINGWRLNHSICEEFLMASDELDYACFPSLLCIDFMQ